MLLNFTVLLTTILALISASNINKILELNEVTFSQQTKIIIDQQHGSIISSQNSLIYLFIQGQQTQENYQKSRNQFQSTALSYKKSKSQALTISSNNQQIVEDQGPIHKIQIPSLQNVQKQQSLGKNLNQISFFIVKCHQRQEETNYICNNLGIYQNQEKQSLLFFTSKSEILHYKQLIMEDKLFLFISKLQQNSYFFESFIQFDEQLQKMGQIIVLKNISLKNKAIGLMDQIKSYLSWDLLKFLAIFGVLPFLFGYLSSKSQQKANKKRMQKYGSNTQQQNKKNPMQLKDEKKD